MHTDLETWPQLIPFRQPTPVESQSRNYVAAVFFSLLIHGFIASLLWVVISDNTKVGPIAPSMDRPLIVSLVSLPTPTTASYDELDREVVSAEPHTDPVDQNFQSPSERSGRTEHKSEADSVLISKDQGVPDLEAPAGESLATDATQSLDVAAAGHIARGVVRIPEFEAGLVLTSKGQRVMGPEVPIDIFIATGSIPSIGLGGLNAWEVERMPMTEFELQELRSKSIALYEKNHSSPDVPSFFAGGGLLATPFFLKDIITGNGYKWFIQKDLERQKDTQARVEFMSDLLDVTDTFKQ